MLRPGSLSLFVLVSAWSGICLAGDPQTSEDPPESPICVGPRVTLQCVYDTREYETLGVTVSTDRLPLGLKFWGFTDLHGVQQKDSQRADKRRSFSEYRLSHSGVGELLNLKGLGAQVEYNDSTPNRKDDRVRFGLTFKHAMTTPFLSRSGAKPGWLQWRAFPLETDSKNGQLSLIYSVPISTRVSLSGFADYNLVSGGKNRWVIEPQLNYLLRERLYAVCEYRYNEFEVASSTLRGTGFAFGLRFDF